MWITIIVCYDSTSVLSGTVYGWVVYNFLSLAFIYSNTQSGLKQKAFWRKQILFIVNTVCYEIVINNYYKGY